MEVVRAFNNELSSLYEVRPPISKAKMTQITKCAIKGIKFYKHIVQSVEKFIQKCRPEYKVPGLYVVDSIVRQSRHQFGADKDVFAPRFTKNIMLTFQNLFKCAEEDRPKIVRVLNLWQKNTVFPSDVIQPLLDMANPNNSTGSLEAPARIAASESPAHKSLQHSVSSENVLSQSSKHKSHDVSSWKGWSHTSQVNDEPMPDSHSFSEISMGNAEKVAKGESSLQSRDDMLPHLSHVNSQSHVNKILDAKPPDDSTVKFNKKLLDFDYGDEEDEEEAKREDGQLSNEPNALALSMAQNLLSNPELLRQLQQMQQTIQQNEALKSELALKPEDAPVPEESEHRFSPVHESPPAVKAAPPPEKHQDASFPLYNSSSITFPPQQPPLPGLEKHLCDASSHQQPALPQEPCLLSESCVDEDERIMFNMPGEPPLPPRDLDERSLLGATSDDRPPNAALPFPEHQPNLMQFQFDNSAIPFPSQPPLPLMDPVPMDTGFPVNILPPEPMVLPTSQVDEDDRIMYSMPGEPPLPPHDLDERSLVIPGEERVKKERSRSRSGSRTRVRSSRQRSRSRSPRRKKSRSRSGSRSRPRRNRSRSREKLREKEKEREREREREREHERKRKGIPPKKKNCMSVCSTTLWLGHVPKTISEAELTSTFGEYGTISSIDMIPPRGCAYICMDRRQDAYRCLTKLKNLKLQNCSIKMAWAPGKGVKGKDYKDYWEVALGVSYIPFEKLPDNLDDLDLLEEGGFIDEESMPEDLREMRQKRDKKKAEHMDVGKTTEGNDVSIMKDTVLPQPPSMMPPSSMSMPMMMPQLMQPQFGVHIPGLLPPHSMVMPVPMGVPPPNPLMMVQPPSQPVLGGQPLPVVGTVPQMPHLSMSLPTAPVVSTPVTGVSVASVSTETSASPTVTTSISLSNAGDATPTEEEGTSVSTPGPTSIAPSVPNVLPAASLQSSVSIPSTGIQPPATVTQFNPVLGLHNGGRPVISVPPPVSATGAPIPFPPPNVNFGFPPPPIRPPGQLPNSPSFPWLQKPGAPGFLNYPEADGRFASPLPTGTPNVRPVPPPPPVAPQSGLQPYGVRLPHFPEMPASDQTITSTTTHSGMGEMTNNRKDGEAEITSSDFRSGDVESGHGNHNSMKGFQHDHMKVRGHLEDSMGEHDDSSQDLFHGQNMDYPHDDYSGLPPNPRFPGDFHHPRGPMNMPWMHGPPPGGLPSPRFPRGIHPGSPFPHRMGGPRGMHPRMEMDFHRHQGPRGPRMPMGNPHGPQNRRGGGAVGVSGANSTLLQTPRHPGGRERFPGRRGEFYDSPFERDHDRRYRDRDDWGRGRDRREPRDEKEDWNAQGEDWERPGFDKERERKKSDSQPCDIPESQQGSRENRVAEKDSTPAPKRPRLPPSKVQTSKDLTDDFFRLQFYSRDKDKKPQLPKDIRSSGIKEPSQDILVNKDFPSKQHGDTETEQSKELQSEKPISDIKPTEPEESCTKQEDKLNQSDTANVGESPNKSQPDNVGKSSERGTRERKRSRWGRTISEEREFQQQRRNEIEMKFNNYALLQTTQTESNVNGSVTVGEGAESQNNTDILDIISSAVDVPEVTSTTDSNSYSAEVKEDVVNIAADTKVLEDMVECGDGMGAVFDPVPEPDLPVEANCVLENTAASDVPEIPHETNVTYNSEKDSPSQIPEVNDSEVAPTEEES